jgi:DNA invertase Pin-like site-specific DNA recombinase
VSETKQKRSANAGPSRARHAAKVKQKSVSPTKSRSRALKQSAPEIRIIWRQVAGTDLAHEDAVRQIAATVLGHIQRPVEAPTLMAAAGAGSKTAQTASPLSYIEDPRRIAAIQWSDVDDGVLRAVTDTGEVIELKTGGASSRARKVGDVERPLKPFSQRRPMIVNRRPGDGGLRRKGDGALDPTEGIDEYGVSTFWSARGGAHIGIMELDPAGTAVIVCRLSSEEKNDRLVDQLRPCLALAKQHGLVVRLVIFAVMMSGTREVRPERAAAPPEDVLERDDMLKLDEYIEAGWVEHVIARGGDRIARDILPGETLLVRWAKHGIGLWLSDFGRRMNYATDPGDRMLVRTMMMISAEERSAIVRRLQTAALNKGPLAGNGHLGPTRFGFVRDKATRRIHPDPEQWPWVLRTFELADTGTCLDRQGLSIRKVTVQLREEGCPFDHDRVRTILKDKVYATGEYAATVRGIKIAQTPIELTNPVPIDRFARVQEQLALRQGRSERTPLGEFLFNYVKTLHTQCAHIDVMPRRPSLIKGYVLNRQKSPARLYRHAYSVPDCCRSGGRGRVGSFTWERDVLERPVIEAVRELATHPELLKQLQIAARHTVADTSARLTKAQRTKIEHEIIELKQLQEQAVDDWIDRTAGGAIDLSSYQALMSRFESKIQTLERRLEMDERARQAQGDMPTPLQEDRVNAFLEIMTVETPTDPTMRQLRARLFQRIVSAVEIDDSGEGPITVTIEGHLVPEGAPLDAGNPVIAAEGLLDIYAARKSGKRTADERILEEVRLIETDLSERADKSVSTTPPLIAGTALTMASTVAVQAASKRSLTNKTWRWRTDRVHISGVPAWRLERSLETA